MRAGDIYPVAGNGMSFSGDGGLPVRAEFSYPSGGVSVDGAGDIAFNAEFDQGYADTTVELISARSGTFFGRRLTAGHLYTLGGDGSLGFRGDGGPVRNARFCMYAGFSALAFDGGGNLVVADGCNNRVRLIAVRAGRFFGRAMTAGDVYTIAGTGAGGLRGRRARGQGQAVLPSRSRGSSPRQRAHRRLGKPTGAGHRRRHRHLLRQEDDRGPHLHRGRPRCHPRRRRPRDPRPAQLPVRGCLVPHWQPAGDRRPTTTGCG
jgi:hypothetical protein